jgi:hypothetical protein
VTRAIPRFALPHLSDEAVAAFADGVLPPGPQSRARQHLAECVDCAGAVRDQRAARWLLRSAQTPAVPGSLLERLRQLPTATPSAGSPIAGLSMDGQPVFAAYQPPARAADAPPVPHPPAPVNAGISLSRRRGVPLLGVSTAAAATLIVGVLAGTASTAGGGSARPADQPVTRVVPAAVVTTANDQVGLISLDVNR